MSQAQAISRVRFVNNVIDPATGIPNRQEFATGHLYTVTRTDGVFAITSATGTTVYVEAEASWTVPAQPVQPPSDDEVTVSDKPSRKKVVK